MWEWRTIARSPTGSAPAARTSSGTADREEVEGAVEVSIGRDLEVRGGDCRNEAVVEGPRQAKRSVNPVPAHPQRQLVDAQLAGVKDAQHLGAPEAPRQQPAILGQRVL